MLSSDLANTVKQYLGNSINLAELNEWLAGRLPSYVRNPESDDARLVGVIELGLAEIGDDVATEDDLRLDLREFMTAHPSVQAWFAPTATPSQPCNETASTNETVIPADHHLVRTVTTAWMGVWERQEMSA